MPKKLDPTQGGGNPRAVPKSRPVVLPDPYALMAADQAAINKKYAETQRPRPPQRVSGRQNWKRG
jgi:hypothetical protein